MSETVALVELQKKRTDLESHWSNLLQQEKNLNEDVKALEEKVQTRLQGKIKATDASIETLSSKKSDLEKRLAELQEPTEQSQVPNQPAVETAQTNEVPQSQPLLEVTAKPVASEGELWRNEETRDRHREDKRRKWTQ